MEGYVSMLRGVNVSGQKPIGKQALKELYGALGFGDIETYLNSGNVVFTAREAGAGSLESLIEEGIRDKFGFDVKVLIRRPKEIEGLVRGNPYSAMDLSKAHVTFLKQKPGAFPTEEVKAARAPGEDYSFTGRDVYLYCPHGYGRTKLNNAFFERKLKVDATTRNWNTVTSLLSLATRGPT